MAEKEGRIRRTATRRGKNDGRAQLLNTDIVVNDNICTNKANETPKNEKYKSFGVTRKKNQLLFLSSIDFV